MVTHHEVQQQLKAIGASFQFWGRSEVRELEHILVPSETIKYCINGRYEGGFAMLCITDQRIILVDKKPFYLTLEDIRYDMVSEVDFSQRLLDATLSVHSVSKRLQFTALKAHLLRKATAYIQSRVMEFRQQPMMPSSDVQTGMSFIQTPTVQTNGAVNALQHRVTNPYTKVPLMMRRRLSRF